MFWSYGPFTVVSHSLFEQLVPRVVEFNFWCYDELGILGFEEWVNRVNVFLFSRIGLKVAYMMFVLGTHWSRCHGAYRI